MEGLLAPRIEAGGHLRGYPLVAPGGLAGAALEAQPLAVGPDAVLGRRGGADRVAPSEVEFAQRGLAGRGHAHLAGGAAGEGSGQIARVVPVVDLVAPGHPHQRVAADHRRLVALGGEPPDRVERVGAGLHHRERPLGHVAPVVGLEALDGHLGFLLHFRLASEPPARYAHRRLLAVEIHPHQPAFDSACLPLFFMLSLFSHSVIFGCAVALGADGSA